MAESFTCDWCGHTFPIGKRGDGLVVQCPKCAKSLMVPAEPDQGHSPPAQTKPASTPAANGDSPAAPGGAKTEPCPFCGAAMNPGQTKCPACKFDAANWNAVGSAEGEPKKKRTFAYVGAALLVVTALLILGQTLLEHVIDKPIP